MLQEHSLKLTTIARLRHSRFIHVPKHLIESLAFQVLIYLYLKHVHFNEQNVHCKCGMPSSCPISKRLASPELVQSPISDSPCAQNIQEGHLKWAHATQRGNNTQMDTLSNCMDSKKPRPSPILS